MHDKFVDARPSCDALVQLCVSNHTPQELALGWLRYEAVRKMNPRQFGEVCKRNLGGEFFDDIVTEFVLSTSQITFGLTKEPATPPATRTIAGVLLPKLLPNRPPRPSQKPTSRSKIPKSGGEGS